MVPSITQLILHCAHREHLLFTTIISLLVVMYDACLLFFFCGFGMVRVYEEHCLA